MVADLGKQIMTVPVIAALLSGAGGATAVYYTKVPVLEERVNTLQKQNEDFRTQILVEHQNIAREQTDQNRVMAEIDKRLVQLSANQENLSRLMNTVISNAPLRVYGK